MQFSILSGVTENIEGAGVQITDPCTVTVPGDSEFDGCQVAFEAALTNTPAKFSPAGRRSVLRGPGWVFINIQGTYFLRGVVRNRGENTNIDADASQ